MGTEAPVEQVAFVDVVQDDIKQFNASKVEESAESYLWKGNVVCGFGFAAFGLIVSLFLGAGQEYNSVNSLTSKLKEILPGLG